MLYYYRIIVKTTYYHCARAGRVIMVRANTVRPSYEMAFRTVRTMISALCSKRKRWTPGEHDRETIVYDCGARADIIACPTVMIYDFGDVDHDIFFFSRSIYNNTTPVLRIRSTSKRSQIWRRDTYAFRKYNKHCERKRMVTVLWLIGRHVSLLVPSRRLFAARTGVVYATQRFGV
jgi:hypothetical protein